MPELELDDAAVDRMIRDALRAVARPGDPTGVAEAIRARLRGPDGPDGGAGPGPSGGGVGGPAGGSGPAGAPASPAGLVLGGVTVGAAVLALVAGTVLGANGAFGRPDAAPSVAGTGPVVASAAPGERTAAAYACPGADVVGSVREGDRVLALGAHDAWVAIRDPRTERVVWVDSAAVVPDPGQPALEPMAGCSDVVLTRPTAEPGPTEPPAPTEPTDPTTPSPVPPPTPDDPPPPPPPPSDTTPPTVGQATVVGADPTWGVFPAGTACEPQSATVQASPGDDVGVTGVTAAVPGQPTITLTPSGSTWSGTVGGFTPADVGTVTITVTARDAAGNTAATTTTLRVTTCLI